MNAKARFYNPEWPRLREYDANHLSRIALPLGGIGTGTVSLGGRGNLRDWEVANRPAKGFIPTGGCSRPPFFCLFARRDGDRPVTRLLEGPLEPHEHDFVPKDPANGLHGLPRFRTACFAAAYPFGQILLQDPDVPLTLRIEAFNPLTPPDVENSGIPVAILRFVLTNTGTRPVQASVCGTVPNFIGNDGREAWRENRAHGNGNECRSESGVHGIFMTSGDLDPASENWGSLALATTTRVGVSQRSCWSGKHWGVEMLEFWDEFSTDGKLRDLPSASPSPAPLASLAVRRRVPAGASCSIVFLIAWHFPNRLAWGPDADKSAQKSPVRVGNAYCRQYHDAWDVARKTAPRLKALEHETLRFVKTFCESDLPVAIKEAALFNLANLRSQTCFRTEDGHFFGFEGCLDNSGSCWGSCTHVWNYEQTVPFLFGSLARSMRTVEFRHATDPTGRMSFRVHLPLERARDYPHAAADGQLGCLMKLYRDWQLSGDTSLLRTLWPDARRAMAFCWIPGGWDADKDGVMEGCQHNTMDVEYFGPNPQMQSWYLGALRACEAMADFLGETLFAQECRRLFDNGSRWMDAHLFNGHYYEQHIQPPADPTAIAKGLLVGMGSKDLTNPAFQLGNGCLIDQLVGQYMAHICGLGYILDRKHVGQTLSAILRHNRRKDFYDHFNSMRTYATGNESGLLMASYPKGRPEVPFPYFAEVMTGFEYTVAVGLIQEGRDAEGVGVIRDIRARYDGKKRSPFNEAECGHHYARAMAAWAAVPAYTGFRYSAVTGDMRFSAREGHWFWSSGDAWGSVTVVRSSSGTLKAKLHVARGRLRLQRLHVGPALLLDFGRMRTLKTNITVSTRGMTAQMSQENSTTKM